MEKGMRNLTQAYRSSNKREGELKRFSEFESGLFALQAETTVALFDVTEGQERSPPL
jgi:hypothetical protein